MSDEESGLRTEAGNESMDPPVKKIRRFEDLIAWQKARELTKRIYSLTRQGNFERDSGLRDQIRRAAVSVMSNLAEGFDRGGRAEFHQFLVIAGLFRRSEVSTLCRLRCWIYITEQI